MESKEWEYKEHFHAIGMTGDYSGHYEVSNGHISLCTNDDPEDITETENTLQKVARVLNESGCKFYCDTTTEHKLHVENMELRYKADELKERYENMAKEHSDLNLALAAMLNGYQNLSKFQKEWFTVPKDLIDAYTKMVIEYDSNNPH
jgi:hypothetical protein